ncbi:hypothetical protein CYMTET_45200, partial [Cymbomonas tetramitiformis]
MQRRGPTEAYREVRASNEAVGELGLDLLRHERVAPVTRETETVDLLSDDDDGDVQIISASDLQEAPASLTPREQDLNRRHTSSETSRQGSDESEHFSKKSRSGCSLVMLPRRGGAPRSRLGQRVTLLTNAAAVGHGLHTEGYYEYDISFSRGQEIPERRADFRGPRGRIWMALREQDRRHLAECPVKAGHRPGTRKGAREVSMPQSIEPESVVVRLNVARIRGPKHPACTPGRRAAPPGGTRFSRPEQKAKSTSLGPPRLGGSSAFSSACEKGVASSLERFKEGSLPWTCRCLRVGQEMDAAYLAHHSAHHLRYSSLERDGELGLKHAVFNGECTIYSRGELRGVKEEMTPITISLPPTSRYSRGVEFTVGLNLIHYVRPSLVTQVRPPFSLLHPHSPPRFL